MTAPRQPLRSGDPLDPAAVAFDVVTRPDTYALQPALLAHAWATLKEARGQSVNLDRIAAPAHLIAPAAPPVRRRDAPPHVSPATAERIRARIRAHMTYGAPARPDTGPHPAA